MSPPTTPAPGASATLPHQVTDADTAATLGSGDLPVLGTPRLLAWAEEATCAAVSADLDSAVGAVSTVGTRVRLEHVQPSPVGATVTVRAHLTHVDGRLLRFDVSAEHDDGRVVASGEITRVVVDRDRFLARTSPPA